MPRETLQTLLACLFMVFQRSGMQTAEIKYFRLQNVCVQTVNGLYLYLSINSY